MEGRCQCRCARYEKVRSGGGLTLLSPGATGEGAAQHGGAQAKSVTSHRVRTMRRRGFPLLFVAAAMTLLTAPDVRAAAPAAAVAPAGSSGIEYFEKRVRPILAKSCYECHSAQASKVKADFTLDTRAGLLRGGESGKPAIVPGNVKESPLLRAVPRSDKSTKPMPPKTKLGDEQIAVLTQWIRMGAPM